MKQKKLTKILIVIFIILISCCIKTTSYAVDYAWSDTLSSTIVEELSARNENGLYENRVQMYVNYLYNSQYVFCRQRHTSFGEGRFFYLDSEIPENKNPRTCNDNGTEEDIELAYIFNQGKDTNSQNEGYSTAQYVYWYLLNPEEDTPLSAKAQNLLSDAISYKEYRKAVIAHKNANRQTDYAPIINQDRAQTTIEGNFAKVGPYTINYAKAYNANTKKGFGTLTLAMIDENGNALPNDAVKFMTVVNNQEKFYNQSTITTGDIDVTKDFYIYVDLTKGTYNTKLKVTTSEDNYEVMIYYIKTDSVYVNDGYVFCIEHESQRSQVAGSHDGRAYASITTSYNWKCNWCDERGTGFNTKEARNNAMNLHGKSTRTF